MGLLDLITGRQPMQAQTSMQPQSRGLLGNLSDPLVALPLAGALMQPGDIGSNIGQGFAFAGQGLEARKKLQREEFQDNATAKWLESQGADAGLVELAKSGAGATALQQWNAMREKPIDDIRLKTAQLQLEKLQHPENDQKYYGNPVYLQDENGNIVLGQMSDTGTLKRLDTGGLKLAPGVQKVDLGDRWGILDRAGNTIGYEPKNLANAERQKALGDAAGKAEASAPGDIQAAQNALDLIASIRSDPNREFGTGKTSVFNAMPGTGGYDFQQKVEQAKSGAFLTAIQQMRGLGALSNAEGGAATQAVTRMNTATTEQGFLDALGDYEKIVKQGMARAQARLNSQQQQGPNIQPPSAQQGGGVVDYSDYFGGQ